MWLHDYENLTCDEEMLLPSILSKDRDIFGLIFFVPAARVIQVLRVLYRGILDVRFSKRAFKRCVNSISLCGI